MERPPRLRIDTSDDGVRHVVLAGGRGNAMDPGLLEALEAAFGPEDATPTVLRADGRAFCTGLDLIDASSRDRDGMRELMATFHRALRAVFTHAGPVVAAINGHAIAGGALLAFCADLRIMAEGSGRFGVHGVQLGVVYPDVVVEILRHQLPASGHQRLLFEGRLHDDAFAHRAGWIDERVAHEGLTDRARALAAARATPVFVATKRRLRAPAAATLATIDDDGMRRWLDRWFAADTSERRAAALRALRDREGHRPGEDPAHHAPSVKDTP